MTRHIAIYALFVLFSIDLFAQSSTELAILNLSKEKNGWMKEKDLSALNKVLHDNLKFIHSNGKEDNKESFLRMVEQTDFKKLQVYDVEARSFNKNAVVIVTGKMHFSAAGGGNINEYDLIFTEVYTKYKKNWQLITRHAGRL